MMPTFVAALRRLCLIVVCFVLAAGAMSPASGCGLPARYEASHNGMAVNESVGSDREVTSRQAATPLLHDVPALHDTADQSERADTTDGRVADGESAAAEPATRREFPETLYVNHRLITDEHGHAVVEIPRMADSITTWKVRAQAHTADGAFGEGEATFRVFRDLFLNLQMPPTLTAGDIVEVPLTVMNYADQPASVAVTIEPAAWFEVDGGGRFTFDVPAGGANKAYATIRALFPGEHTILVRAQAGSVGDAVELPVRVEPPGIRRSRSQTVQVAGTRTLDLRFPRLAPDNAEPAAVAHFENFASRRVVLTVAPRSFQRLLAARRALLRLPTGCLEQTLSGTLINLDIARSYAADAAPDSRALETAVENLGFGYQRLLGFYSGNGRFGSFPGRYYGDRDQWLAGYALYVMKGLAQFVEVDADLLAQLEARFAAQHASQQALTDTVLFGLWGYVQPVGDTSRDPAEFPTSVRLLLDRLRTSRPSFHTAYELALLLNIWGTLGEIDSYHRTLDEIFRRFPLAAAGDEVRLPKYETDLRLAATRTGARGHVAAQEVAALVVLGTTHDLSAGVRPLHERLITALAAGLDARGIWSSTFTTGLAMRAFAAAERHGAPMPQGTLVGSFNGVPFEPIDLGRAAEEGRLVQMAFDADTANTLVLTAGHGLVDVRIDQTMVFPDPSGFPLAARAFDLRVTPGRPTLSLGQSTTLRVQLARRTWGQSAHLDPWWPGTGYVPPAAGSQPAQVVVSIGLPGTFRVFEDSLEAMQQAGRIERYEISGREVRLYLFDQQTFECELTVISTAVGNVTGPASMVHEYYNPAGAGMAPPLSFQVTR